MADMLNDDGNANHNTALLQKLATAVNGHAATATFACGGSVPISVLSTRDFGPSAQNQLSSVTIRTDTPGRDQNPFKVTFPLAQGDDVSSTTLDTLLAQCERATIGMGGRDVLDESYRKASKLDPSAFSTNFHPHDYGIVDSIQQILLPSMISEGQGIGIGPLGVRADLYKLNIYSAPSGKFKSHVDTPRGAMQFGSLVVCLPCEHEGGALQVKHRGQTVEFAWGDSSPGSIQWAAFYGDCEHEVLEVMSGHRVTLTYNLYYSSIDNLTRPVWDPYQLPLFGIARDMLLQPAFMRKGGILGFFCHHQYAHANDIGRKSIPGAFKGVDLAVYSVFHALGLKVGIHPIVEHESKSIGGLSAKELMRGSAANNNVGYVEELLEGLSCLSERPSDVPQDEWDVLIREEIEEDDSTTIVGTKLHSPRFYNEEQEDHMKDNWPHKRVRQILWMNEPQHKDFAYSGIMYGNQAEIDYAFSAAAILVIVPPSEKRNGANMKLVSPHEAAATPSTIVAATPASGMSAADPASNTPPGILYFTLVSSSWDAASLPPVTDVARPGYNTTHDSRDDPFPRPAVAEAFGMPAVEEVAWELGTAFHSTQLGAGEAAADDAFAMSDTFNYNDMVEADASALAMSDAMWYNRAGTDVVDGDGVPHDGPKQ